MRQLEADEQASRERAEQQVRDAAEEARRRVRAADDEVAELRRLRGRVSAQLATLRTALGALPGVDAFPDEDPTGADGRPSLPTLQGHTSGTADAEPATSGNGTGTGTGADGGLTGGYPTPEQRRAATSST